MANSVFLFDGVPFTGQMIGPAADNTAAPPFTFAGDLTTGYASSAAGMLDLVTVGTSRLSVNSTRVLSTVPVYHPDGSATTPPMTFASTASTLGWYRRTSSEMTLTVGGVGVMGLDGDVTLVSNGGLKWTSGGSIGTGSVDTTLVRDGASILALKAGNSPQTQRWYSANAGNIGVTSLTELTTIAAAGTTTTTIQMPAGAIVMAVNVRVTTVIPTATSFSVGDSGSATRFSTANVSSAATSTDPGTKAGAYYNATATGILLTMNGGTPADNSGRVRVTIYYFLSTPPTS